MYKYSKSSLAKLKTCHKDLQIIFMEVIKICDVTIIEGHRSVERQHRLFRLGRSKLDGITKKSKHNYTPSLAVDVIMYHADRHPHTDWTDYKSFYYLAGLVKGIAFELYEAGKISHLIRWGGDWDGDNDFRDQRFNDLGHFELIKP